LLTLKKSSLRDEDEDDNAPVAAGGAPGDNNNNGAGGNKKADHKKHNPWSRRPLPFIIGTKEFLEEDYVGLDNAEESSEEEEIDIYYERGLPPADVPEVSLVPEVLPPTNGDAQIPVVPPSPAPTMEKDMFKTDPDDDLSSRSDDDAPKIPKGKENPDDDLSSSEKHNKEQSKPPKKKKKTPEPSQSDSEEKSDKPSKNSDKDDAGEIFPVSDDEGGMFATEPKGKKDKDNLDVLFQGMDDDDLFSRPSEKEKSKKDKEKDKDKDKDKKKRRKRRKRRKIRWR